jgi:hypothetical protein
LESGVLTNLQSSQVRRAASISIGLAVLWIVVAFLRSGSTFHLAPILVAAAFPIMYAFDPEDRISARDLLPPTVAGLAIALVTTLILAVAGEMTGPSLLPFGGAATEAVVFSLAGAIGGFGIGLLRANR